MTNQEILDAINASVELTALAADGNTQAIADALSVGRVKVVPRMVSARGLSERMAGGPFAAETVLLKLEGARDAMLASQDPQTALTGSLLRRQLTFLGSDGLDFGSVALRDMLDQFQAGGVLTAGEVTALKAIAEEPEFISHTQVGEALKGI